MTAETPPRTGISLPGQATEQAAAEVGSEAGKSLIRGIARLGAASVERWITTKHARAEAGRLAIETDARLAAAGAIAEARRKAEFAEIEHRSLLQRRLQRLEHELRQEQANLEAIEADAVRLVESDPQNRNAQEIDDDWLFRFADLSQRVSDKEVQAFWSHVLASAAIRGVSQLSAAALQTLSMFDAQTADDFRKFVAVHRSLEGVPLCQQYEPLCQKEPQNIDLGGLKELGLIDQTLKPGPFVMFDAEIGLELATSRRDVMCFSYSRRGWQIAAAVFRNEALTLPPEIMMAYAKNIVAQQVRFTGASIVPLPQSQGAEPGAFFLRDKGAAHQTDWRNSSIIGKLEPNLLSLLDWADGRYAITIADSHQNSRP